MGERDVVALERVDRDDGDSVSGGETRGQQARKPSLMRGVILTLAGGTLWGLNGTLSKVLMGTYGVDPLWLACARELTACWLFLAVAGTHSPSRLKGCLRSGRALLGVASVGICSILLSQVAYLEAIDWTNSATATVLQSLSVVIVMLFVCLVNRRLPRKRELVGVALAFTRHVPGGDWWRPGGAQAPAHGARLGPHLRHSGDHPGHPTHSPHRALGQLHRQRPGIPDLGRRALGLRPPLGAHAGA
ncbi:MAG: DMT family transporter [Olsenella sp.]|nr:DMT family transporter [Olsenella sp.]